LCISLGSPTGAATLRGVFGSTAYAAAPSFAELTPNVGRLVATALAGADRSRTLSR
jgi:hypothetical protein